MKGRGEEGGKEEERKGRSKREATRAPLVLSPTLRPEMFGKFAEVETAAVVVQRNGTYDMTYRHRRRCRRRRA